MHSSTPLLLLLPYTAADCLGTTDYTFFDVQSSAACAYVGHSAKGTGVEMDVHASATELCMHVSMPQQLEAHLLHDRLKHEAVALVIHSLLQGHIYAVMPAISHTHIFH